MGIGFLHLVYQGGGSHPCTPSAGP